MGKNRSGVGCLLWLVSECGYTMPAAVEYLRSINFMALGNPVLLMAVVKYLEVDPNTIEMLCPDADGVGGFLSISPTGTPIFGNSPQHSPRGQLGVADAGELSAALDGLAALGDAEADAAE